MGSGTERATTTTATTIDSTLLLLLGAGVVRFVGTPATVTWTALFRILFTADMTMIVDADLQQSRWRTGSFCVVAVATHNTVVA